MLKKVLIGVAVVVLVPVLAMAAVMASTFGGLEEMPDGKDLAGGVRLIKDGYVGVYLLPSADGSALVDCGNDPEGTAILAELKKRSLGPENIKAIFLTHGHPDHIAACHLFKNAEVYAFAADAALADGSKRALGPMPSMMNTPENKRIKVTKTLTDGETVSVGALQVTAFAVPGHTGGSASFLTGGVLLMGDNATVTSKGELRPAPWVFSDDGAQNKQSLKALAGKLQQRGDQVAVTAYAHSGPSEGMKALAAFTP